MTVTVGSHLARDMLILFDLRILGCLTADVAENRVSGSCHFLDGIGPADRTDQDNFPSSA